MRLPFYYLTESLQKANISQIISCSDERTMLLRPKFYRVGDTPEPNRLYISDTRTSLPNIIPDTTVFLMNADPVVLLNQVQEIYDRCESWEESLRATADSGEIRELLDEVETILNNPILLHKSNYSIVACSTEVYSNEQLTALRGSHLPYDYVNLLKRDPQFEQHAGSAFPYYCSTTVTKSPALSINLLTDAEMGYCLTALPLLKPLRDSDRFLLTLAAGFVVQTLQNTVIAGRYEDPTGRKERLMELFRTGVENENADLIVLEQGFSSLRWLPTHQYCCLSIQIGTPDYMSHTVELLCNQLETKLPEACMFTRLGVISVLIDLTLAGTTIRAILEKNRYFFRDNDLRCGVSNIFTGFSQLRNYQKQSLIALGYASRPQAYLWTQYFSEVVLDYILEQSNRELPLHLICSQQVLQLKQYDTQHQTEFYSTLECYIRNKFNAVQTARELQIHRSTFLYRMERLQTLFRLDLDQQDSLLYILLSMKMLELSKSMILHE